MTLLAPYQAHSDTSREAAESITPKIGSLQAKVLAFIAEHGPVTDPQISDGLGLSPNSIRPRRIELTHAGKVQQYGTVIQPNRRRAATWVVTSPHHEQVSFRG